MSAPEHRKHPPINPCDFGVPEAYREMAENYANWRVHQEREACAQVCEHGDPWGAWGYVARSIAASIRARSQS